MGEVTASWIPVGEDHVFQRTEVYGPSWYDSLNASSVDSSLVCGAPLGGPVLVVSGGVVRVHTAAGHQMAVWKWKSGPRLNTIGWSNAEEVVFVLEDGTVLVYDVYGSLKTNFSMGQEARDLKIIDAQVFHGFAVSGVAVITSARRFFVVNNLAEPRVRKLQDIDWIDQDSVGMMLPQWAVLTSQRQARLLVGNGTETVVLSQSDIVSLPLSMLPGADAEVCLMAVAHDSEHVAVLRGQGLRLWLGEVQSGKKLCEVALSVKPSKMAWCGESAVLCFQREIASFQIVTTDGHVSDVFMPDFLEAITELDGVRILTRE